jgi:hypothetical protein
LDDPEPEPPPAPPVIQATGEPTPVSGCTCAHTSSFDSLLWLLVVGMLGRRRLGGLRQAG